jgi:hypothetical protein
MLGCRRPYRRTVERFRERLAERDQPLHLRNARRRLHGFDTHLLALSGLMDQEDDGKDGQPRHQLETPAMIDLAGAVQQGAELTRRDDPQRDREAPDKKSVMATDYAHLSCLSVFGGVPLALGL